MKLISALLAAMLVFPGFVAAQAPTKADAQKWSDTRNAARNKGDWAGFAQSFTTDATVVTSDGSSYGGRAEIQKRTQDLYGSGIYKGVQTTGTVTALSAVSPDVVVVDATFELNNIPGGGTRKGFTTTVYVKQGADWKVAATRSMVPTKLGAVPAQK